MAGDAIVGALRAILGLDTAAFEEGAKRAATTLSGLQKQFLKIGSAIGTALALGGVTAAIKGTINDLEELNKTSQKIAMPVEELSALKYAAGLADIQMEALSTSMVRLAKNMAAAATSTGGPAAQAFKALGIEVLNTEGSLKSQSAILEEIADKFQSYADSAEKTALAVAIFGKAGAQMIPLLNQGGQGLRDNAAEARRFGVAVDGQAAEAAERFNDNLKRLEASTEGLRISFVQGLLPSLNKIAQEMVDAKEAGDGLVTLGELVGRGFEYLALTVKAVIVQFATLGTVWTAFKKAVTQAATGDFTGAMKTLGDATKTVETNLKSFGDSFVNHFSDKNKQKIYEETEAWLNLNRGISGAAAPLAESTRALEQFINSTTETVQSLRAQVDLFGQNEGAIARAKFQIQALAAIQKEGATATEAQRFAISAFGKEIEVLTNRLVAQNQVKQFTEQIRSIGLQTRETAGEFAGTLAPGFLQAAQSLKVIKEDGSNLEAVLQLDTEQARQLNAALFGLSAARLTAEFLSPYDLWLQKLREINAELGKSPEKQELLKQATVKATAEMQAAYAGYAMNIVGPVASAFKDLASINKKYAGIAKAAAIGEALVATYLAANKALATTAPWPLPVAFAAAAVAAGLANVAKISATPMATGGSFKVGGAGGIDSQLITMAMTPGEMVDVRKPGQDRGATTEITMNVRGRDRFTGDDIRELFAAINQGTSDGYRLKIGTA